MCSCCVISSRAVAYKVRLPYLHFRNYPNYLHPSIYPSPLPLCTFTHHSLHFIPGNTANMGRWSKYTESTAEQYHSMKRVGYDADDQVTTFQDKHGNLWHTAPGTEFGQLKLVERAYKSKRKHSTASSSATSRRPSMASDRSSNPPSPSAPLKSPHYERDWAHPIFRESKEDRVAPPPAYQRPQRRFTDFDQLDLDTKRSEDGLVGQLGQQLGRRLSLRPSKTPEWYGNSDEKNGMRRSMSLRTPRKLSKQPENNRTPPTSPNKLSRNATGRRSRVPVPSAIPEEMRRSERNSHERSGSRIRSGSV